MGEEEQQECTQTTYIGIIFSHYVSLNSSSNVVSFSALRVVFMCFCCCLFASFLFVDYITGWYWKIGWNGEGGMMDDIVKHIASLYMKKRKTVCWNEHGWFGCCM